MSSTEPKNGEGDERGTDPDLAVLVLSSNSRNKTEPVPPVEDLHRLLIQYYPPGPGEKISQEEVMSLNSLPCAQLVPSNPQLRDLLFRQMNFRNERTHREKFEDLKEILSNPKVMGEVFFGTINNTLAVVNSNWEYLKEGRPDLDIADLLLSSHDGLTRDEKESLEDTANSLEALSDGFGILNKIEEGPLLRVIYFGRSSFGRRGIRRPYRDFMNEIYPSLPPILREKWGMNSLPSHREMVLKIWRLIHTPSIQEESDNK
jgi:hypothetical protein